MAVGDIYRLSVIAQGLGSTYMNTYAFRQKTASITTADVNTLAVACKELFRGNQAGAVTYRSWRATQEWGGGVTTVPSECRRVGGVVFEGNYTTSTTGGLGAGDMLPPQCSLVVTINTGFIGRRKRGRLYAFGYLEVSQTDGLWSSTTITQVQSSVATFSGLYVGPSSTDPTWEMGVWSERTATDCVPLPSGGHNFLGNPQPDQAFTKAASLIVRSTVFSQRRRTVGVGR